MKEIFNSKEDEIKGIGIKLALKAVCDIMTTFGIYPQSTSEWNSKTNKIINEKKRTEWQDGWNAAVMKLSEKLWGLEEKIGAISDDLALLMIADVGWLDDGKLMLNMNDTFYYAADCEEVEVTEENIKEIARLFTMYGVSGIDYWVAEKRGYDPEVPKHKLEVEEVRRREIVRSKKLRD